MTEIPLPKCDGLEDALERARAALVSALLAPTLTVPQRIELPGLDIEIKDVRGDVVDCVLHVHGSVEGLRVAWVKE